MGLLNYDDKVLRYNCKVVKNNVEISSHTSVFIYLWINMIVNLFSAMAIIVQSVADANQVV